GTSLLFLVLPTTLVHIPLLDTVYPLLTALVLVSGLAAIETAVNADGGGPHPALSRRGGRGFAVPSGRGFWLAGLTGLLLAGSIFYTAAAGIITIPLVVYGLLRGGWRVSWLALPAAGAGALLWLVVWLAWGINMPAILQFIAAHQAEWH